MKLGIGKHNGFYILGDAAMMAAVVEQGGEVVEEPCEWPTSDVIEIGRCEVHCPECGKKLRMRKDGCLPVHRVIRPYRTEDKCQLSGAFYVRLQ